MYGLLRTSASLSVKWEHMLTLQSLKRSTWHGMSCEPPGEGQRGLKMYVEPMFLFLLITENPLGSADRPLQALEVIMGCGQDQSTTGYDQRVTFLFSWPVSMLVNCSHLRRHKDDH